MKLWSLMVAALAASPAMAGPGGQYATAGVPTTMVVGDGGAYSYAPQFAAYLGTFGAPAYTGRSQRGQQTAPEGEVLARLTFGRQTTSRTRGDADFKVGDVRIEKDSDAVTSRTVTVSLSGFGRNWAKTDVSRESDSSWRVRGDDVEVEKPNRRSSGSALDATLQRLAKDTAVVIKAGASKLPAPPPPFVIGTGGAVQSPSSELDPLFQAETAAAPVQSVRSVGTGFVLVSADPQRRPCPVVVTWDSKQLSKSSLLVVYGQDGRKKCSITVYWNTRYRAWTIKQVFPAVGGGTPVLGDRAELN